VLVTSYGGDWLNELALRRARCLRKPVDAPQFASAMAEVLAASSAADA
jgi:hypothetical protein